MQIRLLYLIFPEKKTGASQRNMVSGEAPKYCVAINLAKILPEG